MFETQTIRNFIVLALVCVAGVAIMNLRGGQRTDYSVNLDQSMRGQAAQLNSSQLNSPQWDSNQIEDLPSQPIKLKNDHSRPIVPHQSPETEFSNGRNADGQFAVQQASHRYRVEWASESETPIKLTRQSVEPARQSVEQAWNPSEKLQPQIPRASLPLPNTQRYSPVQQTAMKADDAGPVTLNEPTVPSPITVLNDAETIEALPLQLNEPSPDSATQNTWQPYSNPNVVTEPTDANIRVAENSATATKKKKPVFQPSNEKPDNDFRVASAPKKPAAKKAKDKTPRSLVGADNYVLAGQPQVGDHWKDDTPLIDKRAMQVDSSPYDFSPDPIDASMPYDPYAQMQVYEGKTLNSNQRPLVELGRPWYQLGQLSPGYSWFGKHNNVTPQFLVYGDVRTAVASNTVNGDNVSQIAGEINLDFDLKLTGTERFHMFWSPIDGDEKNTRYLLDDDEFIEEFDADIDFGYFEGDLGAIVGGFTNQTLPFDLPFAVGVIPMLVQNGVWMEDAFLGVAATIPARNSPKFSISNMDVTFFAGYDKITSDAFPGDDSAARMYGMLSFIEAMNGYFEIDYAFLDDRTFDDRSYHNIGIGFTRRYGRLISNSTRVIVNAGQDSSQVENTADGVLLLSENSLITSAPSTFVPYANFFAGYDRPQSAARAGGSGGVLRNTGILFESDGITDYPTLDATANETFGGALGLNIIADDFSQQLVLETAFVQTMGDDATRNASGNQYGIGFRYQLPLTNAIIFRTDGMYGFLNGEDDVRGLRFELRHKY